MKVGLKGDFDYVSDWDDDWEVTPSDVPQPLRGEEHAMWHNQLLKMEHLHQLVGGYSIVRRFGLMYVPRLAWNDGHGAAIGWPIYEDGELVNVVRRFLGADSKRYTGLRGRGHQLWPDRSLLPGRGGVVVLVVGMRDACVARAAGTCAFTTTGGVEAGWPDGWLSWLAPHRRFHLVFDVGEEKYADRLGQRLMQEGAMYARTNFLPRSLGPGGDLCSMASSGGVTRVERWLQARVS